MEHHHQRTTGYCLVRKSDNHNQKKKKGTNKNQIKKKQNLTKTGDIEAFISLDVA